MPFIQNRSAFFQSKSHDGRTDVGEGEEKCKDRYLFFNICKNVPSFSCWTFRAFVCLDFPGPPQDAEPSSSGRHHSGHPTPPISTATSEDPLAGALLGLAEYT